MYRAIFPKQWTLNVIVKSSGIVRYGFSFSCCSSFSRFCSFHYRKIVDRSLSSFVFCGGRMVLLWHSTDEHHVGFVRFLDNCSIQNIIDLSFFHSFESNRNVELYRNKLYSFWITSFHEAQRKATIISEEAIQTVIQLDLGFYSRFDILISICVPFVDYFAKAGQLTYTHKVPLINKSMTYISFTCSISVQSNIDFAIPNMKPNRDFIGKISDINNMNVIYI